MNGGVIHAAPPSPAAEERERPLPPSAVSSLPTSHGTGAVLRLSGH